MRVVAVGLGIFFVGVVVQVVMVLLQVVDCGKALVLVIGVVVVATSIFW